VFQLTKGFIKTTFGQLMSRLKELLNKNYIKSSYSAHPFYRV